MVPYLLSYNLGRTLPSLHVNRLFEQHDDPEVKGYIPFWVDRGTSNELLILFKGGFTGSFDSMIQVL